MTTYRNSIQDDMNVLLPKFPPDDILESLYKLRMRESHQLKTVLELYVHQKISKPDYHKLNPRNSGQEISKPEIGELREEQWLIAGVNVA